MGYEENSYLSRFGAHTIAIFFSFILVIPLKDAHFSRCRNRNSSVLSKSKNQTLYHKYLTIYQESLFVNRMATSGRDVGNLPPLSIYCLCKSMTMICHSCCSSLDWTQKSSLETMMSYPLFPYETSNYLICF